MFVPQTSRHWSCSEMHSQVTRTCAHTPQETHSTWTALTQILAGRTVWCERTSVVMLSFSCRRRTVILLSCKWKTCIFSVNALLTTLVPLKSPHTLLRNQISAWDEKLALRLCLSSCGHREAELPLPQGCSSASSCRGREQWRRCGCSSVQQLFQGEAQKPNSAWVQRQEHNSALGRVWALIPKLHKTQQLCSTPYCKGSVISTLFITCLFHISSVLPVYKKYLLSLHSLAEFPVPSTCQQTTALPEELPPLS